MVPFQTMAAKKQEIHFNNYFAFLWEYAQSLGLNKGEWMTRSTVGPQRFTEFMQAWLESTGQPNNNKPARNLTAPYFLKVLSPLQITPHEVESMTGHKFTVEQKNRLKYDAWVRAQEEILLDLMDDPGKWELCKEIWKLPTHPRDKK